MRIVLSLLAVLLAALACGTPPAPEPEPEPEADAHPIVGVWGISSLTTTDADGNQTTVDEPQPGGWIFTAGGHYASMYVPGAEARALFGDGSWPLEDYQPTEAEQLAAFGQFIANAGRYEITDTSFTTTPVVSKHPNLMGQGTITYEYSIDGDTLTISSTIGGDQTLTRIE